MNKKIQKTLTRSIMNQIYIYDGSMEKETLYGVLEATDGVTGEIFDIILEEMIRNEECIVEKIHNLKDREIEVIFITNKGLEYVTDKNISIKTMLKKKLTYELKCGRCSSYSEWLDQNRERLCIEQCITEACVRSEGEIWAMTDAYTCELDERKEILTDAIEHLKKQTEEHPEISDAIEVSILFAIYDKLQELISTDKLYEEAKKAYDYVGKIRSTRSGIVDAFLG